MVRAGKGAGLLAHRRYSVAAGRSRSVAVELNGSGRHLLSTRVRVKSRVELTSRGGASRQSLTLSSARAPAVTLASAPRMTAHRGALLLRVHCRAPRQQRCHASLLLASDGKRLGHWRRSLPAGGGAVRLQLSPRALAKLHRRGKIALRVAAVSEVPVGRDSVERRRVVVWER